MSLLNINFSAFNCFNEKWLKIFYFIFQNYFSAKLIKKRKSDVEPDNVSKKQKREEENETKSSDNEVSMKDISTENNSCEKENSPQKEENKKGL